MINIFTKTTGVNKTPSENIMLLPQSFLIFSQYMFILNFMMSTSQVQRHEENMRMCCTHKPFVTYKRKKEAITLFL